MDEEVTDLIDYYRAKGASKQILSLLEKEKLTKGMITQFSRDEFVELDFSQAQAIFLVKNLPKLSTSASSEFEEKVVEQLQVRPFMSDFSGKVYPHGAKFGIENVTSSPNARCLEFKELAMYEEKAFINKARVFIVACINGRVNGTIAFGVADSRKGKNSHGTITGVSIDKDDDYRIIEAFQENFKKSGAAQFHKVEQKTQDMIQQCIKHVQVIKVSGCTDYRVVIEIDIRPSSPICGNQIAYVRTKSDNNWIYAIREGSDSNRYKVKEDDGGKKIVEDLKSKVEANSKRRASDEGNQTWNTNRSFGPRIRKLMFNGQEKLDDTNTSYILVADSFATCDDCKLDWVSRVKWEYILDLDVELELYNSLDHQNSENLKLIEFKDFPENTANKNDALVRFLEHGTYTPWVVIRSKSDDGLSEWIDKNKALITRLITSLDTSLSFPTRAVVIFLVASERYLNILELLLTEYWSLQKQTVILTPVNYVLSDLEGLAGPMASKIKQLSINCKTWPALDTFMKQRIQTLVENSEHKPCIPVFNGSREGVDIAQIKLDEFSAKGIHILPMNHLQDLKVVKPEADAKILEFLKGSPPSWEIFLYSELEKKIRDNVIPGLVYRKQWVQDIKEDIQELLRVDKDVNTLRVAHQPGSGATTLLMHSLWELKDTYRCAQIDGRQIIVEGYKDSLRKLNSLAANLYNFQDFGEEKTTARCPLLVLVDNCTDEIAQNLKDALEVRKTGSHVSKVIIVYLVRTIFFNQPKGIEIRQQLSECDKMKFHERLEELRNSQVSIQSVLSFVIIASDFNKDNRYLKNFVDNAINGMTGEVFELEKKVLVYLCILKVYGGSNKFLPTRHCHKLLFGPIDTKGGRNSSFISKLNSSSMIISERKYIGHPDVKQFMYLEITHCVLAELVLLKLIKNEKLSTYVMNLLEENILKDDFVYDMVHDIIKDLLNKRNLKNDATGDDSRKEFSDLVLALLKKESFETVLNILKAGYEKLDHQYQAKLAQTIARFYSIRSKNFEQACIWSKIGLDKAMRFKQPAFPHQDTIGQIYKMQQRYYFYKAPRNQQFINCYKNLYVIVHIR